MGFVQGSIGVFGVRDGEMWASMGVRVWYMGDYGVIEWVVIWYFMGE